MIKGIDRMLRPTIVLKVLLLGDGAVGKTALRERYLGHGFQSTYLMTIGADFALHKFERNGKQVKIQIWDLAGQDRFQVVRSPYYNGAHGALLVYDVTRLETLENIDNWITETLNNTGKSITLAFIGNKTELRDPKDTKHLSENAGKSAIKKLAEKHKLNDFPVIYYETSAKTGENVAKGFESLTEVILNPKNK